MADEKSKFASAVASTDAKRAKTAHARDGGTDQGFLHARMSTSDSPVCAGVKPYKK